MVTQAVIDEQEVESVLMSNNSTIGALTPTSAAFVGEEVFSNDLNDDSTCNAFRYNIYY